MQSEFKSVKLSIRSVHLQDGEKNHVDELYEAKLRDNEGEIAILYSNGEKKRHLITVSGKRFERKELGSQADAFVAELGKKTSFVYQTPYGDFDMECKCTSLEVERREPETKISLSYSLFSGKEQISRVDVTIKAVAL